MIKEDLTGKVFGRLTVLRAAEQRSKQGYIQWVCQCNCRDKTIIVVPSYKLKYGHTRSCGCLQRDTVIQMNRDREKNPAADRDTRLYRVWRGIRARTSYESQLSYKNYGGRGISICDEWHDDFSAFRNWALANGYSDDLTIDRLDIDGDYTPDNCRWATRKEQNNNQRSNIRLSFDGETHTASQWAEIMGITKDCIYKRIRRGYTIEAILKEFIERRK